MFNAFRTTAVAAVLALAPLTASALTVLTIADSGTVGIDLLADSYDFDENFVIGTAAGTLTFGFTNSSASDVAITLFGWSVEQNLAEFTNGVSINFGAYAASAAQGASTGASTSFFVSAGQNVTLSIGYGAVVDNFIPNATDIANIDFSVQAAVIPVPAAGLMLLTGLGGMAAMRRRKTA